MILGKLKNLNLLAAVKESIKLITANSNYVKSLNLLLVKGSQAVVSCNYNEDDEYFTLHYLKSDDKNIISSEKLKTTDRKMNSGQTLEFSLFNKIN